MANIVTIAVSDAEAAGVAALTKAGAPEAAARAAIRALIENEIQGYPSHGVMRVPQYVAAIGRGVLDPAARPELIEGSNGAAVIEGHKCFGVLAAEALAHALIARAGKGGIAAVGLRRAHHIGRLAAVVRPVAEAGHIALGFANYGGVGQWMAPWGAAGGGRAPRLGTNPLAFAAPDPNGSPIVFDMTTTTVSEGGVRAAAQAGKPALPGWLVDGAGQPVRDPRALYAKPPQATLAPLGAPAAGHKGFGLALMAELLAGVITGGGFVGDKEAGPGNSGLFLAFAPDLLPGAGDYATRLEAMLAYVSQDGATLPGRHRPHRAYDDIAGESLELPEPVWAAILKAGA